MELGQLDRSVPFDQLKVNVHHLREEGMEAADVMNAVSSLTFFAQGRIAFVLGLLDEARTCFERVIDFDGEEEKPEALYNLGCVYLEEGSYELAQECFVSLLERSTEDNDLSFDAIYNLGYCYYQVRDYPKAQNCFENLKTRPEMISVDLMSVFLNSPLNESVKRWVDVHFNLGRVLYRQGMLTHAYNEFLLISQFLLELLGNTPLLSYLIQVHEAIIGFYEEMEGGEISSDCREKENAEHKKSFQASLIFFKYLQLRKG